jgi:hypothetical protein
VFMRVDSPTPHEFFLSDSIVLSPVLRVTIHPARSSNALRASFLEPLIVNRFVACCASRYRSQCSVEMMIKRLENCVPIVTRFVLQ